MPVNITKTGERCKKSKNPKEYQLNSLGIKVNIVCLPAGYSTESILKVGACDYYHKPLNEKF